MQALIINNSVVDVVEKAFDVHSSMLWVECDESVLVGHSYSDGIFTAEVPYSPTYSELREREYPTIEEVLHAILDNDMDALQAKRALVKAKYPKGI